MRAAAKYACPVIAIVTFMTPLATAQTLTTLYSFGPPDGVWPLAGLVQGTDGSFYGTTSNGGAQEAGTVFRISRDGELKTLYNFCQDQHCSSGEYPKAALVQAGDGDFYGTASAGGVPYNNVSNGTVFKITPNGQFTLLHTFCSLNGGCPDGALPLAPLVQAGNGDFYGTTSGGGSYDGYTCNGDLGCGTVFKMTPRGVLTTLHEFCVDTSCPDGHTPYDGLLQGSDGVFYGTTLYGGVNNSGTVFEITPDEQLTTVSSFAGCYSTTCANGAGPESGLTEAANGGLYGATTEGGPFGAGIVFKMTAGERTTVAAPAAGAPLSALVEGTDGNLYGSSGDTLIRITPEGAVTTLYTFCTQTGCPDGAVPEGSLIQATDGAFYGATFQGGVNNYGTIFRLSVGLDPFVLTRPTYGEAGTSVEILGTDLAGASSVTFNGKSGAFTVLQPSLIITTVPPGATTGTVRVATPRGTLSSNVTFRVRH